MTSRPLFRCSTNKLMAERDLKTLASVTVMMVSYYALAGEILIIYKIFGPERTSFRKLRKLLLSIGSNRIEIYRIDGGNTNGYEFEKSGIYFEEGCIKV